MLVRRFAAAVALTTALAFTVPLSADAASVTHSSVRISTGDVDFETSRTKLSSDSRVFSRVLSDRYHRHVDADDVFALRANFDLGFGDISLAYGIAERSGRSVYEVAAIAARWAGGKLPTCMVCTCTTLSGAAMTSL